MPVQPNQFSTDNPQSDAMQIMAEQFDPGEFEDQSDDGRDDEGDPQSYREQEYEDWLFGEGSQSDEEADEVLWGEFVEESPTPAEEIAEYLQKRRGWDCS